jgi:hypothetical protein
MDRHPDSYRHPHHGLPPHPRHNEPPRHTEPPMHHYHDPRHSIHHRGYGGPGPDLGNMLAPPMHPHSSHPHPHPHMSTGHSLPPPDGHAHPIHPSHVAASSPSLSGASGYSPNNPPTNGSHPVEHPSDKSNPLSGLMNHPHSYERPSHPPETASSLGLNTLDDNWFMPWICSTPGGNGEVAPSTPNYSGAVPNGNGNGYMPNQHQIPRALLPGDLSAPVPTSSNLWQHSLAAVQGGSAPWTSGLRRPTSRNAPTLDIAMSAPRQEIDDAGRDTFASNPSIPLPEIMTESGPRQGTGARESITSASDRDTFRRRSSNVDIEEIVSWSNVLSFLSLYHEHL